MSRRLQDIRQPPEGMKPSGGITGTSVMAERAAPKTTNHLPDTLRDDIAKLGQMAEQVKAGALDPDRFRAFRVPMGVYEQRENGRFMPCVRLPGGGLLPHQMRALADASERLRQRRPHT